MKRSGSMTEDKSGVGPDHFDTVVFPGSSRRRSAARRLRIFAVLVLVAGLGTIAVPFTLQYVTSQRQATLSSQSEKSVSEWPYPKAKEALEAADQYNRRLVKMGQPVMGEAVDPFNGGRTEGQSEADKDETYQTLLNQGSGIMGAVVIPKISVNIPIYHGTSERSLTAGAGHLYGSSLPVGGKSSHAVVTGHRGLVNAPMFTRLDEIKVGDTFYIKTMGKTLGYRVDRISVIEPNDTARLKIVPEQDRVTLMTCTPYGVNTHRLLVSATRAKMPEPVPFPKDAKKDRRIVVVLVAAFTLLIILFMFLFRARNPIIRHAAGLPIGGQGRLVRQQRPEKGRHRRLRSRGQT